MKSKFASNDVCAVIHDLKKLIGMRCVNVYDINSKTYIIKLQKPNDKAFILFESGIKIHITTYDWPKSIIPSGFSMKFRKHIRQKRLRNVSQVGLDRIVDLHFGDDERSYHVIVELYDRGNVVLTDYTYTILNILRPRTDADSDVRFSVKEKYPVDMARKTSFLPSPENIFLFLNNVKSGEPLRKSLARHAPYGAAMLDHALYSVGLNPNAKIGVDVIADDKGALLVQRALEEADKIFKAIIEQPFGGFIASKVVVHDGAITTQNYQEFYPYDFEQYKLPESGYQIINFNTFSEAVDAFFSSIESQKEEQRVLAVENEADRRVDNIRRDHEQRIKALEEVQEIKERRAEYIQYNREIVDQAILLVRTAIANKMSWDKQIPAWLGQIKAAGISAALAINKLQLDSNTISLSLGNPYDNEDSQLNVEIDLALSAEQNVRKYFTERRAASQKLNRTEAAKSKAVKSAKVQAKSKVDHAKLKQRQKNVVRARKTYWFEKFLWFISSDDYLVLAGRDAHQNELLVKRYMRPGDLYVHSEIQGAASVVIRNRSDCVSGGVTIPPPKTLTEAGTFAICFSKAWEEKVVVNAYWVYHDQVSKAAQPGEYLSVGAFVIRGKRNFLPTAQLTLGWGLMFRLDDESTERHRNLRNHKSEFSTSELGKDPGGSNVADNVESNEEQEKTDKNESDNEEKDLSEREEEDDEFPDVQLKIDSLRVGNEVATKDEKNEEGEDEDPPDNDEEEARNGEDGQLFDELTSFPLAEDSVLFALSVCAPYSVMQRYKFKVKITPGTGKRGKATKSALALFMKDKSLSLAEKTLLKGLSVDDRIAQNLPAKVRVSAPQMQSIQYGKTK